jgi:predicted nucleic acid-binding protein
MRTAIDSNVISSLWSGEQSAGRINTQLVEARAHGALVMCAPVFVELSAHPFEKKGLLERFVLETDILVDFDLGEEVWKTAASGFASYAQRRRRSGGNSPKRLLVDYIVGAHALVHADQLMTLDPHRYALDFPRLRIL